MPKIETRPQQKLYNKALFNEKHLKKCVAQLISRATLGS